MPRSVRILTPIAIATLLFGCVHLNKNAVSLNEARASLTSHQELLELLTQRQLKMAEQYKRPEFKGNIATSWTDTNIKFSDNTVYLGNYLAWQAYQFQITPNEQTATEMLNVVKHIHDQLATPKPLPGETNPNYGYFVRDNITESTLTINGKTYAVSSDGQSPKDNEMSQDQVIHVLFGYYEALRIVNASSFASDTTTQLKELIISHAHDIGRRLKAYNYVIVQPDSGQPTARGSDARGLAWPLAETISAITGQPLTTYLEYVYLDAEKTENSIQFSQTELRDLFWTSLKGLTAGVCDIKVGADKHYLCHRYTLRLLNIMYYTSKSYEEVEAYVLRMDADGDYLGGFLARMALEAKVPKSYISALNSAVGQDFADTTSPSLWCDQNRWIMMPSQCPHSRSDAQAPIYYNAVDFLGLMSALGVAPPNTDLAKESSP